MSARITVLSRLLLAFAAVALAGALSGVVGLYFVSSLSSRTDAMYLETTAPLTRLFTLNSEVVKLQATAQDLGELRDVTNSLGRARSGVTKIDTALSGLVEEASTGSFRDFLANFGAVWERYKPLLATLMEEAEAGDAKRAADALSGLEIATSSQVNTTLATLIATFIGRGTTLAQESKALATQARVLVLAFVLASFLASAGLAVLMGRYFALPLRAAAANAAAIAAGDLTVAVAPRLLARRDEFGDLSRALEAMTGELAGRTDAIRGSVVTLSEVGRELEASMRLADAALAEVGNASRTVGENVEEQAAGVSETAATVRNMARTIEGLDREIGRQAEGVASSSASIEEMVGNIGAVAESIVRLGESFEELKSASEEGKTRLDGVISVVADISSQSDTLREANSVVAGIAAKTNLLAMNAAIEAAHAGDAGRGFAVVADEIRSLAENAARQSKEISRDIGGIRASIEEAVRSSESARMAFGSVVNLLDLVGGLEREINASLEEQREGSRQALESLAAINEVTTKVRSGSIELDEGSKAIGVEMGELEKATVALREAASGIERSVAAIAAASRAVGALSGRNREAIDAVEGLLACYVTAGSACVDGAANTEETA